MFVELAKTRGAGLTGASPITYTEIYSWSKLTDRRIRPHEVHAIINLDRDIRDPEEDD